MSEFVFTSPGAKFRERDITFVTRNVGVTTLGLVGETMKGPAFEPIFVQDKGQFSQRFGAQSAQRMSGNLQYQLPYVANAYLGESNQLWVTRVLGLSGFDAGSQWAITLDAGVDPSTISVASTTSGDTIFTNNTYLGVSLYAVSDTGSTFTGFTKTGAVFSGVKFDFTVLSITGGSGTVRVTTTTLSGTAYSQYENMVLATIRSRGYVMDSPNVAPTTIFDADNVTISGNTTIVGVGDMFGEFVLKSIKSGDPDELFTVTLNPNSSNFISNVLGTEAKDKKTPIWIQSIYPDLIKKLDASGDEFTTNGLTGISPYGYGINTALIKATTDVFTNYKVPFQTPETPWIVSQLKGNVVDRLFKFISISDGNSANQEIKISITNINPETGEFNVIVRSFYDTDANPIIYETYSRCSMVKGQTNYIAQRIGTSDGEYNLLSKYVMLELAPDAPIDGFPAGFEGYEFNNYSMSNTGGAYSGIAPEIFYKTEYNSNERLSRVYLGISNSAYNGTGVIGTGINQNFFNFNNWRNGDNNSESGFTKTYGFHMDSGATGSYTDGGQIVGSFKTGAGSFKTVEDIVDSTQTYYAVASRKFTVVPSGGFDGWNVHRTSRSYGDNFRQLGIYDGVDPLVTATNDFQAWETAINTFANPEQVTINLFATPGINWSDNNVLVRNTIEMIETERTDSLYVVDSPDVDIPIIIGSTKTDVVAAGDIVSLLDNADIDSSYSCTYFPWIQLRDTQNNVNVFLPPTGEVVKAMAFTDNTKFPWFAPAGLQRGVTDAKKSKYKLSLDARDVLYKGRINPLADFAEVGTAIFGQKTLQVKESALDRINVRRLILQVKVLISNIAIRLVFEQGDQTTIDQFTTKANPLLDTIKRERGLNGFYVKMDDTLNTPESMDRNELYGEIGLKPTRSVEFIGIEFTITPSGASFKDSGL